MAEYTEDKINKVWAGHGVIKNEIETVKKSITDLGVGAIDTRVTKLEKDLFEVQDTDLANIYCRLESIEDPFNHIEYTTIPAIQADITTLKGEGEGSVKKTVADEVAKVVASAPEDFDTLKEVSDWIASHKTDAAGLQTAVSALQTVVGESTLEGKTGLIGEIDYIREQLGVKQPEDAGDTLFERVYAIEQKVGIEDGGADGLDDAIEELRTNLGDISELENFPEEVTNLVAAVNYVETGAAEAHSRLDVIEGYDLAAMSDDLENLDSFRDELEVYEPRSMLDWVQQNKDRIGENDGNSDTLFERVAALETTVGDENSGLVKDVAELQATIDDCVTGDEIAEMGFALSSEVEALETVVGKEAAGEDAATGIFAKIAALEARIAALEAAHG